MKLINICAVRELDGNQSSPSIRSFLSDRRDPQAETLIAYLKNGEIVAVTPELAIDVITGEIIPEELKAMSDGVFRWTSDIVHYVDKHNFILPEEFRKHVLDNKKQE
jgi:hypothetical protein